MEDHEEEKRRKRLSFPVLPVFSDAASCRLRQEGGGTLRIRPSGGGTGALKVPDVSPEDYPPGLSIFSEGIYHLYDYQFFYRNLEENVGVRLEAYAEERAMDQAA